MVCSQCGRKIRDNDAFCGYCGNTIDITVCLFRGKKLILTLAFASIPFFLLSHFVYYIMKHSSDDNIGGRYYFEYIFTELGAVLLATCSVFLLFYLLVFSKERKKQARFLVVLVVVQFILNISYMLYDVDFLNVVFWFSSATFLVAFIMLCRKKSPKIAMLIGFVIDAVYAVWTLYDYLQRAINIDYYSGWYMYVVLLSVIGYLFFTSAFLLFLFMNTLPYSVRCGQ